MNKIIVDSQEMQSKAVAIRVYFCLLEGLKNRDIAQKLNISYEVARYQSKRIVERCQLKSILKN